MIIKLLTIFAPWPYAGDACAKSQAWFGTQRTRRMAAILSGFFTSVIAPYVYGRLLLVRLRAYMTLFMVPTPVTRRPPMFHMGGGYLKTVKAKEQ